LNKKEKKMIYPILAVLFFILNYVQCEVISPSHNYNVTLPEPNAPYVAGQMLPISYTLPDDTNLPKRMSYRYCYKRKREKLTYLIVLQLSVLFTTQDPTLNFTDITITSNADISQGFSFRRTHNTYVYYEHQLSVSKKKKDK
jgi:hypothetical protein